MIPGYFGKIPARGDFVGHGLAAAARDAIDVWCQDVLPASQAQLGPGWTPAWMQAPIWRFRVPADRFGPDPATGLWLPSTDRAGRLYPLIFVITGSDLSQAGAGLDRLEALGLAAIERDLTPDQIAAALQTPAPPAPLAATDGEWWTAGGPLVAPARRHFSTLPGSAAFTAMLTD